MVNQSEILCLNGDMVKVANKWMTNGCSSLTKYWLLVAIQHCVLTDQPAHDRADAGAGPEGEPGPAVEAVVGVIGVDELDTHVHGGPGLKEKKEFMPTDKFPQFVKHFVYE